MKKNNQKTLFSAPGGKSYLVPFILITSLFLLWGFAHGLLDVLNKHFQGVFTMTKAESGLVQFSTYIAYFLMALPAGMFMKRFGYYSGGLFAFGISIPDRPFCDCLWALYSGNGSQPLFHDFRAGGIGGATPEFVSIV